MTETSYEIDRLMNNGGIIFPRFSPEELGMQASSAFVWLAIEIAVVIFSLYLVNVRTDLGTWDVVAFCGYKYFG